VTLDDRTLLNEFLAELHKMQVHKSALGEAKKKPLLVLLVLSSLKHGRMRENKILFGDVEERLSRLIEEFGGRLTESGPKPEQPFFHLRTSPFWELTIPGGVPEGAWSLPGPNGTEAARISLPHWQRWIPAPVRNLHPLPLLTQPRRPPPSEPFLCGVRPSCCNLAFVWFGRF
jgi:hypothetical protein